jgi:hypothetical protein
VTEIFDRLRSALAGRYAIEREIGAGGMATVYLARDERHGRRVAVKVLNPDLAAVIGTERFLHEIEIAANLAHPHILPLYDSGAVDPAIGLGEHARPDDPTIPRSLEFLYYVMPYVEGPSLRRRLLDRKRLPLSEVMTIVGEIADALGYAHRQGIVHRDVKPENILFVEEHAVVADFGIAKAIASAGGEQLTRSGFPLGTPGYMSPEQAAARGAIDARTDVYGLACVAYELLVGQTPGMWVTEEEARVGRFAQAEADHRRVLDALPGRVEQVLVRALAIRPTDRYESVTEFAARLAEAPRSGDPVSHDAARAIVQRAADFDMAPVNEDDVLTMGSVERIGAEAGIPPDQVRAAALEIEASAEGLQRGGLFGFEPEITLERDVETEVGKESYGAILEEIRVSLGEMGELHATLDDSLVWSSPPGGAGRKAQVIVRPRDGRTHIRVADKDAVSNLITLVPIAVGSAVTVGIVGAIVDGTTGSDLLATIIGGGAGLSVLTAGFAMVRWSVRRQLRRRYVQIRAVVNRIESIVRDRPPAVGPGERPADMARRLNEERLS